jgi:Flp pilus assembly protein TadG
MFAPGTIKNASKRQSGVAAVEFALVAVVFFTLLLGIIEFGRFMYLWNTVQEVTRNAARAAVVSDFSAASVDRIQRNAIFRSGTNGTVWLPAGNELTNLNVNIQYLNQAQAPAAPMPSSPTDNVAACLDATRSSSCIRFVEVTVCEQLRRACDPIRYVPMVGLFTIFAIDIPDSTVRMPVESLGLTP